MILIFCDPIYSIFTADPVIHQLGRQILYVEFALEIGRSINIVMVRGLTTAGDVWYPVTVGIFSMWLVSVGGSWLLGDVLGWGLAGIWIAMACDECLRGCCSPSASSGGSGRKSGWCPACRSRIEQKAILSTHHAPANGRGRGLLCTYLLRSSNTCTSSRANRRADSSASSGALPAVPTSRSSEPWVAC